MSGSVVNTLTIISSSPKQPSGIVARTLYFILSVLKFKIAIGLAIVALLNPVEGDHK